MSLPDTTSEMSSQITSDLMEQHREIAHILANIHKTKSAIFTSLAPMERAQAALYLDEYDAALGLGLVASEFLKDKNYLSKDVAVTPQLTADVGEMQAQIFTDLQVLGEHIQANNPNKRRPQMCGFFADVLARRLARKGYKARVVMGHYYGKETQIPLPKYLQNSQAASAYKDDASEFINSHPPARISPREYGWRTDLGPSRREPIGDDILPAYHYWVEVADEAGKCVYVSTYDQFDTDYKDRFVIASPLGFFDQYGILKYESGHTQKLHEKLKATDTEVEIAQQRLKPLNLTSEYLSTHDFLDIPTDLKKYGAASQALLAIYNKAISGKVTA